MENSNNLQLPYIAPSQAQKHVTHNEAIRQLDTIVMLCVNSRTISTPPIDPIDGARFIVGDDPQDSWAQNVGDVATWVDNAWLFLSPKTGWLCWSKEDECILIFENNQWNAYGNIPENLEDLSTIGINTQASQINRLSIAANATLLTNEGNDHRLVINKQSTGDTASVVFQNNYSGKAEFGLNGNDNFSLKVSPNGSNFTDALIIDTHTGQASFPNTNVLQNYTVNLYQDSGRFAGNNENSIAISTFSFPQYFSTYNGTVAYENGKFIQNNSTYGGTQAALTPVVDELITKIKDSSYRRYGIEFWVAKLVQGNGTGSGAFTHDGITGRLSLYSGGIKIPNLTFHAYFKAINAPILIKSQTGLEIYKDGIKQAGSISIPPSDGWLSITITDSAIPRKTYSYKPFTLNIFAAAATEYLVACPALMGGITKVDPDAGIIASSNAWPA